MKIWKWSFASRVRLYAGTLVVILFAGPVVHSEAAIYTVSSGIYSLSYDGSQNGFTEWSANGVNQLALQTLYYSVNGGPVTQLAGATVATSSGFSKSITATYPVFNNLNVNNKVILNGNILSESIQFLNSGGSAADISIFQYSSFVLGGAGYAGNQTVGMTPAVGGGFATTSQTGGGLTLGWQGDVPGFGTLVQANGSGAPFGAFIGVGNSLDNSTLTANNTFAVFGYQFSGTVAAGNSLTVSETAAFPVPVPEPSSMALVVSGMFALAFVLRRRRIQNA